MRDNALHDQGLDLVFHERGRAGIGEACGEASGQPDHTDGLAQQQGAAVRGDRATVETGPYAAAPMHLIR